MAVLKTNDKKILEKVFQMSNGGVLNFSNRTFEEFFRDNLAIEIYDDKYSYSSGSKANLMRGFWQVESEKMVAKSIVELISYIKNEILLGELEEKDFSDILFTRASEIAKNLTTSKGYVSSEEIQFLNENYSNLEIKIDNLDERNRFAIEQRISEIYKCIKAEAFLGSVFLSGSTLEGILLDIAQQNSLGFVAAIAAPKYKNKVIPLEKWTLDNFIDTAYELGYLGLNSKIFAHNLRKFRNYIHPREQAKSGFSPDKHTALMCFQVLKSAINDIQNK